MSPPTAGTPGTFSRLSDEEMWDVVKAIVDAPSRQAAARRIQGNLTLCLDVTRTGLVKAINRLVPRLVETLPDVLERAKRDATRHINQEIQRCKTEFDALERNRQLISELEDEINFWRQVALEREIEPLPYVKDLLALLGQRLDADVKMQETLAEMADKADPERQQGKGNILVDKILFTIQGQGGEEIEAAMGQVKDKLRKIAKVRSIPEETSGAS